MTPFINSPIGVLCLVVLCATSLVNIYAHWIEDGLFGRLLYMAMVLTCIGGLAHLPDASAPSHVGTTLLVLFTLKSLRNVVVRRVRFMKYRKQYAKYQR